MSHAYLVYSRPHHFRSEDRAAEIGIYTTRTLAIEAGQAACSHEDDDYYIREFALNRIDEGKTIWHRDCDMNKYECRQFYKQYWPTGYPSEVN